MDGGRPRADLPILLSPVLLAFAIEFEQESPVSFAISANVLRVLDEHGVRVRDLPGLSGVSKEGISMAMGILAKGGLAVPGPATDGGRGQVATLTPRAVVSKTSAVSGSPRSSTAGRRGSAAKRSPRYGRRWNDSQAPPSHDCPRDSSRPRAAGGRGAREGHAAPSTRWCCTAAGSPTATR